MLIDTALKNNQELLITLQEIEIAKNDIRVKQGKLLPSVIAGGGAGIDKVVDTPARAPVMLQQK